MELKAVTAAGKLLFTKRSRSTAGDLQHTGELRVHHMEKILHSTGLKC